MTHRTAPSYFSLRGVSLLRGYTLLELLIVLSITTILASLAVPALAGVIRQIQSDTMINELASHFQLARSTAISQRQPVVFCARHSDIACGSDWSHGALVFADPNDNRLIDRDERLLAYMPATPEGSDLSIKAALNKSYLRFMSNGMLENTAGSLVYCPAAGEDRDARNLIFSRNGRIRFGDDKNRDGIRESADGKPLSCSSSIPTTH
jgi:type IV fimbrial biogenesis protein FimT